MLVDWGLTPLTLMPVYPTPAPASEVVTTEGRNLSKIGKSWPKFLFSYCSLFTLENVIGDENFTLKALTMTSFKFCGVPWRVSTVCFCENDRFDIINTVNNNFFIKFN